VKDESMPIIRVICPKGAHSSEQKATLAPRLVQALIIRRSIRSPKSARRQPVSSSTNSIALGYLHMFAAGPDDRSYLPSATARRASRTRNVP
jgi:hypothetical protein